MTQVLQIAVLAAEVSLRESIVAELVEAGYSGTYGLEALSRETAPDVLVIGGASASALANQIRATPVCSGHPVIVACGAGDDPRAALKAGADDVIWHSDDALARRVRIELSRQRAEGRRISTELSGFQEALLDMRSMVAERGDGPEVLREVLITAASVLGFDRACMMANVEPSEAAYVLAATDDPTLSQFELTIIDYPEVQEAIRTGRPLLIDDVRTHPVTASLGETLAHRGVYAIAVFPVFWRGRSMGGLLFRKGSVGVQHLSENAQSFGILLAAQLAAQLRESSLFERLRDQTRRLSRAGYVAEHRARTIDSLKEYFQASAEGILVLDQKGRVIFINGTGESLLGFAGDALIGAEMTTLVPDEQHSTIDEIVNEVLDGNNIEAMDLGLKTTGTGYITVSMTTSTVLSGSGAVILSFRDVTHQRSLEAQLQQSSEFLSNLIDSAVDAIIAVDMRGKVIVFNQGAEQLFGHKTEDVVNKMMVSKMYPEGVPRQVIRMLRSESYGGVGRLEQIRREVLTVSGALVPVNMTASIIYDQGREVATVGIFSDLRDRIRIEQRLLQAQEQLQQQEQQSMLAELAGAAAHELNQPLTSIIGYAQLIQRTSELNAKHSRYTDTIVAEAERMAEIVKKIGRITHYETMAYVGSTNIVDLDASVEASESAPVAALLFQDEEPTARITLDQISESREREMRMGDPEETQKHSVDDEGGQ